MTPQQTMRGLVLTQSLAAGELPVSLPAVELRRYPHRLGGTLPVEIVELSLEPERVPAVAMQIAEALVPRRFYAHFLDAETMYVAFPYCVTIIRRDDPPTADAARAIDGLFGIPSRQMRFEEMFVNDHPDSPPTRVA